MAGGGAGSRAGARAILRECRRLGPTWSPAAPASDVLWGRGFLTDRSAPHPLLLRLAPACLHEGIATAAAASAAPAPPAGGGSDARPSVFVRWLRRSLRRAIAGSSAPGAAGAGEERRPLLEEDEGRGVLAFLQTQRALSACTSSSEEDGLRIDAVCGFLMKDRDQHVFAYNMRFTNNSDRPLRVLSRQYDFRESSGSVSTQIKDDQIEAAGVVGFTPLLRPGAAFEFGSGTMLKSSRGLLVGRFLVMEEPKMAAEDMAMHESMEEAELMLRLVYYKGLGTKQFHLPLGQLHFDAEVPSLRIGRRSGGR
eukprot:TRINITY_DN26593_c0_g2_i1.p1 TRINITY_DN26593_c0_g2~~TRINITY_DN26593_c0_g2_i1.p1  ORF type:complete len:318 (-),score=67.78 TRINITY_DN26593_c0_g2_i1:54-980(-)